MTSTLVQELIDSGIHFGQRTSGWNPKMERYIYGKRNGIHIIDIKETIKGLLLAKKYIGKVVADGKDVCFVGTKRQARPILIERVGGVKMHHATERWLGGTLTNFRTIRSRLKRLEELEEIERTDNFQSYSKKMESRLHREMRKITRNLDGIRGMDKLPGCMVIIDTSREVNALAEARKLGIPTIGLLDTDGDPDQVDIPIPGNDDSMRAIDLIVRELCAAVTEGRQVRQERAEGADKGAEPAPAGAASPRRRSTRSQFRAGEEGRPDRSDRAPEESALPRLPTTAPTKPLAAGADQGDA